MKPGLGTTTGVSAVVSLVVAAASLAFGISTGRGATGSACATEPPPPSLELVYSLRPGKERVTPDARERAAAIVCERLSQLGIEGGSVTASHSLVRVFLPDRDAGAIGQVTSRLAEPGQLRFYDWEPSLIGPELAIAGLPGVKPKRSALRRAEGEWRAAGRSIGRASNARLIRSGAFPSPFGAVRLASRQPAREQCSGCSAATRRFYAFDRSSRHRLLDGPTTSRAELREAGRGAIVLGVPVGTVVVSEQPSGRGGGVLAHAEPGWFALKDRPALTSSDIVRPAAETNALGEPTVTFGFTGRGRTAFERLTLAIAQRGLAMANGPVTATQAERLSGHMAVVYDSEIRTKPIVDFRLFPHGIDGRTGAQIAGGFGSLEEARSLAAILQVDPLPITLNLLRTRKLDGP